MTLQLDPPSRDMGCEIPGVLAPEEERKRPTSRGLVRYSEEVCVPDRCVCSMRSLPLHDPTMTRERFLALLVLGAFGLTLGCRRINPKYLQAGGETDAASTSSGSEVGDGDSATSTSGGGSTDATADGDDGEGESSGTGGSPFDPEDPCPSSTHPADAPQLVIPAGDVAALVDAAQSAGPSTAILLEAGTYALASGQSVRVLAENVYLGALSGDPADVIIDGLHDASELVRIEASGVTLANVTLRRSASNAIRVLGGSESDTVGARLYNLRIEDNVDQAVKVDRTGGRFADDGELACSRISVDAQTRMLADAGSCSLGGIRIDGGANWVIRDNVLSGLWCPSSLAPGAIRVGGGAQGLVVERNILRDVAIGIHLGRTELEEARVPAEPPCASEDGIDVWSGRIVNNAIVNDAQGLENSSEGFEEGVAVWRACQIDVAFNTIRSTTIPYSSIEYRWATEAITIADNLMSGTIRQREDAEAQVVGNYQGLDDAVFVGPGDFHVRMSEASTLVGSGVVDIDHDIDGELRSSPPTAGADEPS